MRKCAALRIQLAPRARVTEIVGLMALFRPRPLPVRPPVLTLARRVVRARFALPTTARNGSVLPTAQAPSMGFDREARDGRLRLRMAFGSSISCRRPGAEVVDDVPPLDLVAARLPQPAPRCDGTDTRARRSTETMHEPKRQNLRKLVSSYDFKKKIELSNCLYLY